MNNISQETLMMVVAYGEERSSYDPIAKEIRDLNHHIVNNNELVRSLAVNLTPKMVVNIEAMVVSTEFLQFRARIERNPLGKAIVFLNYLMPYLQEGLYLRKDIYLYDKKKPGSKRNGFIGLNTPLAESLVVPFEQCEQDLKDVGIQSSRVHGEYIDWKNLFLLDIPSNLQRRFNSDKMRRYYQFIEGRRTTPLKLGTIPLSSEECVWEKYPTMTKEQKARDPYYQRWLIWQDFERRVADFDHAAVVEVLRYNFGRVFPLGKDHNLGNLLKSIVDTAKIRRYQGAKCRNFEDVIEFYDSIFTACPEFLNLPERLISSSGGYLNGIPLATHPDFSQIYHTMMQALMNLYA